jgi:large subunit ribosomal protein L23
VKLVDLIRRPILTEKSLDDARRGRYTFEVNLKANKDQIKEALKSSLNVKVKTVKTMIVKEEKRLIPKSRRTVEGRVWKKAIVELSDGKLSMFEVGGGEDDKKS